MAIKPVLQIGDPRLRLRSEEVDPDHEDIASVLEDLRDTLHELQKRKQIGRALAAIQIGRPKRIIYMETAADRIVMINPIILEKSSETWEVWDSCFSADVAFFGKTLRYRWILVAYHEESGQRIVRKFVDDLSELFQHEIDHLNGILFTDRIVNNEIIMRSEWEKRYRKV